MDADRFDDIARALTTPGSRRGLLGLLTILPIGGALASPFPDDADAAGRRKRRKKRQKHRQGNNKGHRKGKQKGDKKDACAKAGQSRKQGKPCCKGLSEDASGQCVSPAPPPPPACVPDPIATTCLGQCGDVRNNCNQFVTCDPCTCDPACAFCQRCDEPSDTCEPGPAKDGLSCGTCQQCAGGTCGACANACCSDACCADPDAICHVTTDACCVPQSDAEACGTQTCGTTTNNCGQTVTCTGCAGCCDGNTCIGADDQRNDACDTGGESCTNCLESNSLCRSGACVACDVCPGGTCDFTSVQAALNSSPATTLLICPGTYAENSDEVKATRILREVHLIGAGDGADDATSTILRPHHSNQIVVVVEPAAGTPVTLEALRITGGTSGNGNGIVAGNANLTLTDCTIIDNESTNALGGAGMRIISATPQVTLNSTLITANRTSSQGGGIRIGAGSLTLDARSRVTGNQAANTSDSGGGIRASSGVSVQLNGADNVTDNEPNDCRGGGNFTGVGNVCTGT